MFRLNDALSTSDCTSTGERRRPRLVPRRHDDYVSGVLRGGWRLWSSTSRSVVRHRTRRGVGEHQYMLDNGTVRPNWSRSIDVSHPSNPSAFYKPIVSNVRRSGTAFDQSEATARESVLSGVRDDRESFETAMTPHYSALVRRLVLVLGNEHDAEDVAQEAYLRAFRAWDRFNGEDVRAWLYTIALRLAFNHLRGRRRLLAAIQRVEPPAWEAETDPDLWAALRRLDLRTRTALVLTTIAGFTQAEVALILAVPEGTVSSWLSRGRASLHWDLS